MRHKNQVWINGSFDVLHMGHIKLFQRARQTGLPVVVGVDTDERISELKGPLRPINSLKNRVEFLRSIKYIDEVVVFSTDEELEAAIHSRMPRYMFIGDDYREKNVIGAEYVRELIFVPRYEDLSSLCYYKQNPQLAYIYNKIPAWQHTQHYKCQEAEH